MRVPFNKVVLVCTGARCNDERYGDDRGEQLQEDVKLLNKARGRKPTVRVCQVSCLDLCDHGPNMIADGRVYAHLTRETARAAYEGIVGDGPARPDLELRYDEFAAGASSAIRRGPDGILLGPINDEPPVFRADGADSEH